MTPLRIRDDDLTHPQTLDLLALHLSGMQAYTPAGHVYALDLSGLKAPEVTVFSAWRGDAIASIGALRVLGGGGGEIKSMRTHPDQVRAGVAASILEHIIDEARRRGLNRLSLETGSGQAFEPALQLYRRRGFTSGEAFGGYEASAFNQFMHMDL